MLNESTSKCKTCILVSNDMVEHNDCLSHVMPSSRAPCFGRWVDSKNSTDVTRPWYASRLRFPLSLYYPSAWQEAARRRLDAVCDFDASQQAIEAYVSGGRLARAIHSFTALPCP